MNILCDCYLANASSQGKIRWGRKKGVCATWTGSLAWYYAYYLHALWSAL